ncbi:MAG: DNA polymerase/3'-5' exonuclease PolX [Firmicutes bacterium]|nr:DNA polymerase/3'-5' exonuclease PolX [Bacillota bacterium]
MDRHELARIFNETGLLLELKGENPFKARAYYNAARTVENLGEDLEKLVKEERLHEVPGFGEAIVKKIHEWAQTGKIEFYENLKNTTPPGLLEFLRIPGLGPKRINQLYTVLKISSLEDLEEACAKDRLLTLPGFGARTQEKICAGVKFVKEHRGRFLWGEAMASALELREELAGYPAVSRVEVAGSLRRSTPVVKDANLVAATGDPRGTMAFLAGLPQVERVTGSGEAKISVLLRNGLNVDLQVVGEEEFPFALLYFTGSREHNIALSRLAKEMGYEVNKSGIFRGKERLSCRDEAEVYRQLGLLWIPPELRENRGEIEAAAGKQLPDLVEAGEIRGVFHVHSNYSDGGTPLAQMAEAAAAAGYQYLGMADHSRSAFYAGGLSEEELAAQGREIDALNREYRERGIDFKIFKGIEVEILPSGELDYTPEVLRELDFVIGSVHSHFSMDRDAMTKRILKAMENPYLTMLGHPTGRLLLERPPYEVDLEAVLAKAAEKGVVIEFNANPYRLDLDWTWIRRAKEMGVLIAVNPDAHSPHELDLARSHLPVARKGWLERKDVFNTRTAVEAAEYFSRRKQRF